MLPSTWGVALAAQPGCLPDWKMMSIMVVGAFATRSAGCIINDFWDQDFDRQVGEEPKQGEDVNCVIVGGAYQAEADC